MTESGRDTMNLAFRYARFIVPIFFLTIATAFFALRAWREHRDAQLQAKRNVVYTACVAAMLQNTCAVMQKDAAPNAAMIDAALYLRLKNDGESMCRIVYSECADWRRESCNVLRKLYSPSLPQ